MEQLLTTKLFIPKTRPEFVPRPRLVEKLNNGLGGKLTLVSAPAGYGKTSILSEWIEQQEMPFGWVSLDKRDNDLGRFFSYLIASMESVRSKVLGETSVELPDLLSNDVEALILPLINTAAELGFRFSLLLDDYHRIDNPEIHDALTYLLENLPQNMHLLIATRSDPPLRLAKLRAQGELCEIRVEDLRFSFEEAVQFFKHSMGLSLSSADISTLTKKTEGWVVGLQLAGISLRGLSNKHSFVVAFAGDDRYIADYLLDEALNHQPAPLQTFLLVTSILDRLSAPLCDAVTGRTDSHAILEDLDQANLFLVPLDHQGIWYRYHHLFAELLQHRLKGSKIHDVTDLHQRASIWYECNNLVADAINHALAANEIERIVKLTENLAVHQMDARELDALMDWLDGQPRSIHLQHPWLLVARTWVYFNIGQYDLVESGLAELENILSLHSYPAELVVRIQGHVAAIRSYTSEVREEVDKSIREAEYALKLLAEKDLHLRSFVAIRWANSIAWLGAFTEAIHTLEEVGNASKLAGDGQVAISALSEMAALQMYSGQLNQAIGSITDVKNYAEMLAKKDGRKLPAMGQLYRQLCNILLERNQLSEALFYAREALEICRQWGETENLFGSLIVLARVHHYLGDYDKFEQYINQALQVAGKVSSHVLDYVKDIKIHFLLLQGRVPEAAELWPDRALPTGAEFNHGRRLAFQNQAGRLAAIGLYEEALRVIETLLEMVSGVGALNYTIRYRVLQAKLLHLLNQTPEAMHALEAALEIASPEGYVRTFLDGGEIVAQLLYQAAQMGIYPEYCRMLLDEFSKEAPGMQTVPARTGDLIEPLSERETEVLEHIALGETNQEISQALYLSLYTVKSHARNIFSKLGVKNRTEAVAKARLLGLLTKE